MEQIRANLFNILEMKRIKTEITVHCGTFSNKACITVCCSRAVQLTMFRVEGKINYAMKMIISVDNECDMIKLI